MFSLRLVSTSFLCASRLQYISKPSSFCEIVPSISLEALARELCKDLDVQEKTTDNPQRMEKQKYDTLNAYNKPKQTFVPSTVPLEPLKVTIPIVVLSKVSEIDRIFLELNIEASQSRFMFVGVDVEWKPNTVKGAKPNPIAILQIATYSSVYIIKLLHLDDKIPLSLSNFLKADHIIKTGVGIIDDRNKLFSDHNLTLRGTVELPDMIQLVPKYCEQNTGLKTLTRTVLGKELPKSKKFQRCNWSRQHLSKGQVEYAAADARAGFLIFEQFLKDQIELTHNSLPTSTNWWESAEYTNTFIPWLQIIIDKCHKIHKKK